VLLGYFVGNYLPLGAGEATKVALLNRSSSLSPAMAFGLVAVDRLMDVLSLGAFAVFFLAFHGIRQPGGQVLLYVPAAIIALGLMAVTAWVAMKRSGSLWGLGRSALMRKLQYFFRRLQRSIMGFRKGGKWKLLCAIQLAVLCVDLLAVGCCMKSIAALDGIPPLLGSIKVMMFLMLASTIPLLPGNLGSHQAASVLAFQGLGGGNVAGLAFSLTAQATYQFTIALGAVLTLACWRDRRMFFGREKSG
jgi:uncharacterized protein (TIRG00374 family)